MSKLKGTWSAVGVSRNGRRHYDRTYARGMVNRRPTGCDDRSMHQTAIDGEGREIYVAFRARSIFAAAQTIDCRVTSKPQRAKCGRLVWVTARERLYIRLEVVNFNIALLDCIYAK